MDLLDTATDMDIRITAAGTTADIIRLALATGITAHTTARGIITGGTSAAATITATAAEAFIALASIAAGGKR